MENSTFKVSEIKADEETESLQNVNSEKQADGCKDESELKEVDEEKKNEPNDDFEDVIDESELKEVHEEKKNVPNDDFEDVKDESNEEVGVLPTNSGKSLSLNTNIIEIFNKIFRSGFSSSYHTTKTSQELIKVSM